MAGVLWPGGREGGPGVREVERDFSRSGKDISESGEGREIPTNAGDNGCATEILSDVEIPLDNIGTGEDVSGDIIVAGEDVSGDIIGTGDEVSVDTEDTVSTDLVGAMASSNTTTGEDPFNRSLCSSGSP